MEPQQLDRIFISLADAGRRGMVEQLSLGPATVKELARPANMRLPSALKHLKVLEDGGIVVSQRRGAREPTACSRAFRAINDWVHHREAAMNAAFDRLVQAMTETPEEENRL